MERIQRKSIIVEPVQRRMERMRSRAHERGTLSSEIEVRNMEDGNADDYVGQG